MADRGDVGIVNFSYEYEIHRPRRRDGGTVIALALAMGGIAASVGGVMYGIYRAMH